MKKILLATVALIGFSGVAMASQDKICRGVIIGGESALQLDVEISGNPEQKTDCGFLAKGKIGNKIFKICKPGDECEVKAIVSEPYDMIEKVISVKKIQPTADDAYPG